MQAPSNLKWASCRTTYACWKKRTKTTSNVNNVKIERSIKKEHFTQSVNSALTEQQQSSTEMFRIVEIKRSIGPSDHVSIGRLKYFRYSNKIRLTMACLRGLQNYKSSFIFLHNALVYSVRYRFKKNTFISNFSAFLIPPWSSYRCVLTLYIGMQCNAVQSNRVVHIYMFVCSIVRLFVLKCYNAFFVIVKADVAIVVRRSVLTDWPFLMLKMPNMQSHKIYTD